MSSKKQSLVTLSTIEVEFIVATSCACQAQWLRKLLEELQFKQSSSTQFSCDSSSTIKLAKNLIFNRRYKNIDVRYHFLCDLMKDYVIDLYWKSEDQVVDIFTNPLKLDSFLKSRKLLGV